VLGDALLFDIAVADIMVVAVPDSPVSRRLAANPRERPLVRRASIRIVLVAREGAVAGLDLQQIHLLIQLGRT
jgi:hypothetical protein